MAILEVGESFLIVNCVRVSKSDGATSYISESAPFRRTRLGIADCYAKLRRLQCVPMFLGDGDAR